MNHRTNEGAMDFEYENKTGPVDQRSPWMNITAQQQQSRSNSPSKKRTHSVFNSPIKPSPFGLRDPAPGTTFLFNTSQPSYNSPNKPLPKTPQLNASFQTPRKVESPNYDSSEVDASSPDYNADSDATPDKMGVKDGFAKIARVGSTLARIVTPEKKNPAFARVQNGVSGKGAVVRSTYSHKAENRVTKKRSKALFSRKRGASEGDSADEGDAKDATQKAAGPGMIASLFNFIEKHPTIPHILSFYAQLLLNVFLVGSVIYLLYSFWATIRADVDKKSEEAVVGIMAEMAACAQSYQENRCDRDTRAPALESLCNNWEKCMKKDPHAVGRARVSAHTFAEIFNGFIEPISWKAMIFTFVMVFGCIGISNFAFGFLRNKAQHAPPSTPQYMPTPQRHPSDLHENAWAAYQSPTPRYGGHLEMMADHGSPMRRIQY